MPILIRSKLVKSGGIGIAHFQNFVDSFPAEPAISNEDKLKCLIAQISKDVYDYVNECRSYQEAIQTSQHHFCKTFADDMQAAARAVVGRLFAEIEAIGKRL